MSSPSITLDTAPSKMTTFSSEIWNPTLFRTYKSFPIYLEDEHSLASTEERELTGRFKSKEDSYVDDCRGQ